MGLSRTAPRAALVVMAAEARRAWDTGRARFTGFQAPSPRASIAARRAARTSSDTFTSMARLGIGGQSGLIWSMRMTATAAPISKNHGFFFTSQVN